MKSNQSKILLFLLAGILGLFVFLKTYDVTRPEASLQVRINKDQAVIQARSFIKIQGFDLTLTFF